MSAQAPGFDSPSREPLPKREWLEPWRALLDGGALCDEPALERLLAEPDSGGRLLKASAEEFAQALRGVSVSAPPKPPEEAPEEAPGSPALAWVPSGARSMPAGLAPEAASPEELEPLPEALRRLMLWRLGERTEEFALVAFAERFRLPFSDMHRAMFERRRRQLAPFDPERRGSRHALAAPRGHAKSSLASFLFPLHDLLFGQERYILLVSATLPQSERRLGDIRGELAGNATLKRLFPGLLDRKAGLLRVSNSRELKVGDCRVEAWSAESEMRGLSDGPWRPTKIVLDDAEPSAVADSGRVRERLAAWYNEVVEPLGDAYTRVEMVGTLLHADSLLAKLLGRPPFESATHRAVVTFANDEGLWNQWRDILRSGDLEAASAFFEANDLGMLAGTSVLWTEKEDYPDLMLQMEASGRRAFMKEKQNEPRFREDMVFDAEEFQWFEVAGGGEALQVEGGGQVALESLTRVGFLDSAMGGGDDAAIAIVGAAGGRFYALEVWSRPATPTVQIAMAWELHERWKLDKMCFEGNSFQGLLAGPFEEERARRRQAGLLADLAVGPVHHARSKEQRILALQPLAESKRLLFNRALSARALSQLEQFPKGARDDAPDALAAAVEQVRALCGATLGGIGRRKRESRKTPRSF